MVVLGSREQLCIHEDVSKLHGRAQTNACHSLCKKRQKRYCAHFPRVAGKYGRLKCSQIYFINMVSDEVDREDDGSCVRYFNCIVYMEVEA